jgi:hypothetical protein
MGTAREWAGASRGIREVVLGEGATKSDEPSTNGQDNQLRPEKKAQSRNEAQLVDKD